MRRKENDVDIVYSTTIQDFLDWMVRLKRRYQDCEEYLKYSNEATQDLLHTIELCVTTVQERHKILNETIKIRRQRRAAKNEEAILTPLIIWMRDHPKEIESLESLVETMKKIEENTNGNKFYRSRTSVIEDLFGEPSAIDIPPDLPEEKGLTGDGYLVVNQENNSGGKSKKPVDNPILPPKYQKIEGDDTEEVTLRYPVVVFHSKRKKSCSYYYTFPGLEKLCVPHCFPCADPTMNLNNKKLLNDISIQFNELMIRTSNIQEPMTLSEVNPSSIRSGLSIGNVTEMKVILQEFHCYKRKDIDEI